MHQIPCAHQIPRVVLALVVVMALPSLAIGDADFRYGLGSMANTRMEVLADGKYAHFFATVGIDTCTQGNHASVAFMV